MRKRNGFSYKLKEERLCFSLAIKLGLSAFFHCLLVGSARGHGAPKCRNEWGKTLLRDETIDIPLKETPIPSCKPAYNTYINTTTTYITPKRNINIKTGFPLVQSMLFPG
jgi:hypothetical protein